MSILGIGLDLERVDRFDPAASKGGEGLLREVLTTAELAYCAGMRRPAAFYAVRFAAKEALFKALGTGKRGSMSWRDVEVVHDALDKPSLLLTGESRAIADRMGVTRIHVSLTHTDDYAAAVVVLEG